MIYMLRKSPHDEDYLDGYVDSFTDLWKIADSHIKDYFETEDTRILYSISNKELLAKTDEGAEYSFYITLIQKIK